jgi:DNA-directed RNA polymerase subunit A'
MFKNAGIDVSNDEVLSEYTKKVKIVNGQLISGVIDSAALSEGRGVIVDTLARNYPSGVIEIFYRGLNRLTAEILTMKGMTASLSEFEISKDLKDYRKKIVKDSTEKAEELVKAYQKGNLDIIPGKTLDESFESKMVQLAFESKEKFEGQLLREKLGYVTRPKPILNTIAMIIAKSRGNVSNLTNMAGFWGQASVREGRPKKGFAKRLITSNHKGDVGLFAGGFIQSNFLDGLNAKEYFYHSMGGRQGEVDTGVSTKVSGYLYRRLANSLKDLVVATDGTVRTAANTLIQYDYGEDGVFPKNTLKGKSVDVKEELRKILLAGKK